jgi:hypothetical protein
MIWIMILLLLTSCSFSEVIETPKTEDVDTLTMMRKPHRPPKDTTERKEIGFNITLEDWIE